MFGHSGTNPMYNIISENGLGNIQISVVIIIKLIRKMWRNRSNRSVNKRDKNTYVTGLTKIVTEKNEINDQGDSK